VGLPHWYKHYFVLSYRLTLVNLVMFEVDINYKGSRRNECVHGEVKKHVEDFFVFPHIVKGVPFIKQRYHLFYNILSYKCDRIGLIIRFSMFIYS